MAINQNHTFEDLNGIKCGIVEKNVPQDRLSFLEKILAYNGFTTVAVPSPPPKLVPQIGGPLLTPALPSEDAPTFPKTFTLGVTDVTFNAVNAIFGRLLKTPGGHVVTLAYWQQKDARSRDEIPYFEV